MQKWLKIPKTQIKMHSNLLPVAKEGWTYLAYASLAFILFTILDLEILSILSLLSIFLLIFSFRNPERELPVFEENSVLSPVDGKLISIDEYDDAKYRYKIAIESSLLDVAILRAPMNATVSSCVKKNGAKLNLDTKLATKINENASIIFEDSNQNSLKVSHLVKQSFCGVTLNNIKEKSFMQSSRYGVMLNGITYIYVPQNFRLNVKIGDSIQASKSLLGYFS